MRFLRQNAIAFLALVIALSGTAYAAHRIGAQDIKRNAVRSPHIKNGQVKGADLAKGIKQQIAAGLTRPVATPAPAPASEQLQVKQIEGGTLALGPEEYDGAPIAQCPAGYVVVGTGFDASIGEPGFVLAFGSFVGGFFSNPTGIPIETNVQAICAKNSSGGATVSKTKQWRRYQRALRKARAAASQ